MIEVTVKQGRIRLSGHAGYAALGQDIVCAGVTALTQTLIRSIANLTKDSLEYTMTPGNFDFYTGNLSEAGALLVDSFFLGICQIATDFPEYVRMI